MQRDTAQLKAANKVTIIGALIDTLLGLLKIGVGLVSHSSALIADGIHSLSDLFTDLIVIVILRISHKGPDENHPWGHGHFETVGTALLGSILIAVAGAMAYDSTLNLLSNETLPIPEWPALAAALLSIILKEWIYQYTVRVGRKIGSDLLIANAWHSRTDAISSVVVFIGVAGAMSGITWLDSVAAIAVALMVAKIGWSLSWKSFQELVGSALPPEQVDKYKSQVMSVKGIISVHSFKTRAMGNKSLLEMHIQVSPFISASEGHFIGDAACMKLYDNGDIAHIIYHIDTYDDEEHEKLHSNQLLPMRDEIEPCIQQYLQSLDKEVNLYRLSLHYYKNKVNLEILLSAPKHQPLTLPDNSSEQIIAGLKKSLAELELPQDWLGHIFLATGLER
jgi:cation diffusion facilitator family transporter